MKKSNDTLNYIIVACVLTGAIALSLYYEYSMWDECRETNSFWYCVRVLGK